MKYLYGLILIGICFISIGQEKDKVIARPDIPGELMVDVGFNLFGDVPDSLNQSIWASKSISIYYSVRKEISRKLSFYYGAGLGLEKISLGDDYSLFDSEDGVTVEELDFNSVSKNKLAINYLDIPLEFRLHPKGTQDGEGLFLGIGAIGGIRLNSHTKWKYEDNGQTKRQKISGQFDLNTFRYGYQLRFGFKGVHLFFKSYISTTFQDEIEDATPLLNTVGINFTGF